MTRHGADSPPPRSPFRSQLGSLRAQVKGQPPQEAFGSYVMLAWSLKYEGFLDAALAVVDAAFEEFAISDPASRADACNLRGQVLQKLGRLTEARAAHEEMARVGRESSNTNIEGAALLALGSIAHISGDATAARRSYVDALRLLKTAGDSRTIAQILLNLVALRIDAGELIEADEVLASLRPIVEFHDVHLQAGFHGLLGNLRAAQARYVEAAAAYREALRAARRARDQVLVLKAYQNLGAVHFDLDLPRQALRWYRSGADMARTVGSLDQRIALERGTAIAAHVIGDNRVAATRLRTVMRIATSAGASTLHEAARAAVDLAGIFLQDGKTKPAERLLRQAHPRLELERDRNWVDVFWSNKLAAAARSNSPREEIDSTLDAALRELPQWEKAIKGKILRIAAELLVELRAFTRAKDLLAMSVAIESDRVDGRSRAWANAQAGALLLSAGGSMEAVPFFTRAAKQYSRAGDHQMLVQCLNDSANALTNAGNYRAALRGYDRCLALARRLRDRAMVAQASLNRAEALRRRRTPAEALAPIQRATRAYAALGDLSGHANAEGTRGLVLADLGRKIDAERAFRHSAAIARKAADNRSLAVALGGLADLAHAAGASSKAIALYRQTIVLEQAAKDVGHECETQAGLLVALAQLPKGSEWKRTADRLLHLTTLIRRPELATWAFTEGAVGALGAERGPLAARLFALSMGVPFNSGLQKDDLIAAATGQAVQVVLRLRSHDSSRLTELAASVATAATDLGGSTFGRMVRIMLQAGVDAAQAADLSGAGNASSRPSQRGSRSRPARRQKRRTKSAG